MKRVGDGMRQIRWLDHVREILAVRLAPWAIYPDVREYHRGGSNQEQSPASEPEASVALSTTASEPDVPGLRFGGGEGYPPPHHRTEFYPASRVDAMGPGNWNVTPPAHNQESKP